MRSLLSFFTALPLRGGSLEEAARNVYLLPLVGVIVGLIGGAATLTGFFLPSGVAAALALGVVLLVAGFHHSDGVLDVGDALMVRDTPERRREVLKDTRIGIGGLGALFLVYAPALAALAALVENSLLVASLAVLAGEIAARSTMLLMLAFGEPAEEGSSSVPFVRTLKGWRRRMGVALALLAPVVVLAMMGGGAALAAISVPLTAGLALRTAKRAFGGISGDVVGAAGELGRAVLLVLLSATI